MSLEAAEKYIRDLEALKRYPDAKREREELARGNDQLKSRASELEKEVKELKAKLSREVKSREEAEGKLAAKASEAEELKTELGKVSGELKALKEFKLRSAGGRELTLEQAIAEFLKAQESEIERRANEKYEVLRADLEAKMPRLIFERLIETVKEPPWPKEIASVIETKAREVADWILQDKVRWPDWFKEHYAKEVAEGVKEGIDSEFERRVEEKATERAGEKLKQLTDIEWPRWYGANIKPKLSDLEAKIKDNAIGMLRRPWQIKCDKCGTERKFEPTEQDIADLLYRNVVFVPCDNPDCKDWRIRGHRITIHIHDLIAAYLEGEGPAGA